MIKTIKIGKIVKPQGIKGEVKIYPYVDDTRPFIDLKRVFIDGDAVKIDGARISGSDVFMCLDGISDRDKAELMRGKELSLPVSEARAFSEGGYFIAELIGLEVYVGEEKIGEIKEVLKNGAADVFVIKGEKSYMVPFLKKLTREVDIDGNKIVFEPSVFVEVAYED
ncbi:MAG: 16S rRNA processing protein RimM [Clostridia bacterium]|nr:16S rRNA processing protein RimM [Clostridia bacterium]